VLNVHHRFLDFWESDKVCSDYGVKQVRITKMRPLTIGTLAKASGVHLETVRYYERIGLMPKASRTASNYRSYGPEHVERMSFIRRAREIGFSIGEIKELLVLTESGRASCAEVQTLTAIHLGEVRAKIADLRRLETILACAVERCFAGTPACPVLDMLASRPS
jgi:MerR family transcriptional regulator, mercuric resistance operon regulatory protein